MTYRIPCLLLLVAACGKSDKPESAPKTATAPAAEPAAAPAAARDLPVIDKVDCAKAVPQALVDKYFKGAEMTAPMGDLCEIANDDLTINFNVEYDCLMQFSDAEVADTLKALDGTPVDGLGRAAATTSMQLHVFDDDSACVLTISYLDTPPNNDFVRELLARVP